MKIEFVSQDVIRKAGRREMLPWSDFFEELYKYPNMDTWGKFPHRIKSPSAAYAAAKRFDGIKVHCKREEDGLWVVFGRYEVDNEEVF